MCGPVLAWDWFVLDVAYGLLLLGGSLILRTRNAMPVTWVLFGLVASVVGAFLLLETYSVQMAAASAPASAMSALTRAC